MALTLTDVEWLTSDEAQISLVSDGDGDACLHVQVDVDDDQKGRSYAIRLVDMEGDPAGEAWLARNEATVLDHYDHHQAKQRGVWA